MLNDMENNAAISTFLLCEFTHLMNQLFFFFVLKLSKVHLPHAALYFTFCLSFFPSFLTLLGEGWVGYLEATLFSKCSLR